MSSRLVAVLIVLSVSLTAIAASLVLAGPTFALYLAAMTAVSVAAWLWSRSVTPETNLVSPYLTILPLALLLYSLRYADGWVP